MPFSHEPFSHLPAPFAPIVAALAIGAQTALPFSPNARNASQGGTR
ncbi:MAG: hypothetical protein K2N54_07550 [Helicobacter sp.]|nr:hypothetical protein [Helicobacter sp.]